jgi:hypothetical protein
VDLKSIENGRLYAGIFVVEVLIWGGFAAAAFAGWIPSWPLFTALGLVFNGVVLAGVHKVSTGSSTGFNLAAGPAQIDHKLSEQQAFELTRFRLLYQHGMRIDEIVDRGIEPAVSSSSNSEDARRLFQLKFERVNENEKVGVLLDLEQSIEVNTESYSSLSNATEKVENIRVIRGSKVRSFGEEMAEAKKSLGRNLNPMIRITDDEVKFAEYPYAAAASAENLENLSSSQGE